MSASGNGFTAASTLAALFDRLDAQLVDLAASEQQQVAALQAIGKTATDAELAEVVKAAVAQQTALAQQAASLQSAVSSVRQDALNDLQTLVGLAGGLAAP